MKKSLINIVVLLIVLLTSCESPQTGNQNPQPESTQSQNTTTPFPTVTPLPTPTRIPFPAVVPAGGGSYISFMAYNYLQDENYCGVMDLDGNIIFKMTSDESLAYGRFFCGSKHYGDRVFSPDQKLFAYFPLNDVHLIIHDFSNGNELSYDFSQYISDRNAAHLANPPNIFWIDNERLFFLDKTTDNLIIVNVFTGASEIVGGFPSDNSDFYVQEMSPSTSGKFILIHSMENEQPALFLINTENKHYLNLISNQGYKNIFRDEWSPDSSRFAFFARDNDGMKLVIMNPDGSIINAIEILDGTTSVFWSPDGAYLAYPCSKNNLDYNLCITNKDGNLVISTPTAGYPGELTWAPDSKKLIYSGDDRKRSYVFSLEKGESVQLHEALATKYGYDTSRDLYKWSPDSNWVLITGGGQEYNNGSFSDRPIYASVLCNIDGSCRDYYLEYYGLIIHRVGWIEPFLLNQFSLAKYESLTDLSTAELTFSDNLVTISDADWNIDGSTSQEATDFGTYSSLNAFNGPARIERTTGISVGDGVQVDLQIPEPGALFSCGLSSELSDKPWFVSMGNNLVKSYYDGSTIFFYKWMVKEKGYRELTWATNRFVRPIKGWMTLFLRVRENNQIEFAVYENGKMSHGMDLITDSPWEGMNLRFFCETEKGGTINLHGYKEFSFSETQSTWDTKSLTPIVPTITPYPGMSWEYNWDGFAEGWEAWNQVSNVKIGNGSYQAESTGEDPYLGSPNFMVDSDSSTRISIRMKVSSGDTAQLFFITTQDQTYNEYKSIRFPIIADGEFHDYELDMSTLPAWNRTIYQIRLDPTEEISDFSIDYIRLE